RPRRARGRAVDVEPGGLDCLPGEPVGGVAVLGAHTGARLWRGARVAHPLHARLHYVHHVGFPGDVHAADRGGRGPHGTRPETTEPVTLPPRRSGIFHSLAWLTASNAVVKPLWFLFITVGCIRVLGAAEYGTLTAGLALAGMVIALSEVGTSAYLTREGARGPEETGTLFVNILAGRVGIGLLALVVTLLLGYLLGYVEAEVTALLMAGLYVLGFRLNELCKAVYRAFEVLSYEAALLFVEPLAVLAAGAAGLLVWRNAAGALGGMARGTLASLVGNVWFIHARLSPLHRRALTFGRMRTAYAAALPIGLFFAFSTLLLLTGPVIVEALLGNEAAGLSGA